MKSTINLIDALLERARRYADYGRTSDAVAALQKVSRCKDLPPQLVEEARTQLAECLIEVGKFRRARRVLERTIQSNPRSAKLHWLLGCAYSGGRQPDLNCAADHFLKALKLDPKHAERWSDCGELLVEIGELDEGLKCLRKAVELSPSDPDLLQNLVEGLETAGHSAAIRQTIQLAMFRNSQDGRFRQLWENYLFIAALRQQRRHVSKNRGDDAPAVLPFVRPPLKIVRRDGPAERRAPHRQLQAKTPRRRTL